MNVNTTIINDKPATPDVSINNGPIRTNFNLDKGALTVSIGIGTVRYGIGISVDGTYSFTETFRNAQGLGATVTVSLKPGGFSLGTVLAVVAVFNPWVAPAAAGAASPVMHP